MKFTEDELAQLTPEERDGIEDTSLVDDPVEEEGKAEAAPSPVVAEPAAQPAPTPAAAPEPTAAAPAAAAPDPAAAAAAEVAAAERAPVRSTAPLLHRPPADIDQQIDGAKQAQRDLAAKFDAGDLSALEYEQQRQEIDDKLFDLRTEKSRGAQSFDSLKHHFLNAAVPSFLADHPEYAEGSPLYDALDEKVKILQVTTYKDNPFDERLLGEAHSAINAIRGISAPTSTTKAAIPPKPTADREIMPGLGGLPSAGEDNLEGDGGRFAHLDRLSGLDYETALAALSQSDRDRYLQAE